MSTPIPTSNSGVQPVPDRAPALPEGEPPGIDLGELQRLANSFFQVPSPASADADPRSMTLPSAGRFPSPPVAEPQPVLAAAHMPTVAPQAPVHAPSAPRESAGSSGLAQGVPEAYAPALPLVGAGPGASSSAFYFLDPPATGSDASLDSLARAGAGNDHVTANPSGLPGQDMLPGFLARPDAPHAGRPAAASARPAPSGGAVPGRSSQADSHFSFLDGNASIRDPHVGKEALGTPQSSLLDVNAVRRDFPILSERVNGKPLIWFDNAATTQKPRSVIDRISYFYAHENSNIHRAAHELAARATDAYEGARKTVAAFLGAKGPEEIIFVRGATEAINLVARTYGRQNIGEGDEIIVSNLEHHANIVPWQMLAENKKARIRVIPVDDSGQIRLDEYAKLLGPRTKLVAITQVSNALGTVTPVTEIVAMAHGVGAKVLVDGAQAVSHMRVNVQALDADFYVFSGHKVFGPTGIGVVYGKKAILDGMPPWQGGGNMIADVTFDRTVYQPAPARFEAGTGNIADAVGLGAAIDYVQKLGLERISQYEHALLEYATDRLRVIPGVRLVGTAREKASVLSFVLAGYRTEEVGDALNKEGVAVRSGHHCAQPILRRFGLEATVRPSLAFYNTCEEVDVFLSVVRRLSGRRR